MGGALWEEQERSRGRLPRPLGAREPSELPGRSPALQGPPSPWPHSSWGHKRKAEGRTGEASGRGPPGPEEQERRGGHFPCPVKHRKPAGLPGEVPCPLRPGVGGMPGPLLFLEPKPHCLQPTGPFPALWVQSIGPGHHPNLALAYAPPPTGKAFSPFFFVFFPSSSFSLLWYCCTFQLLIHLYFYLYILSSISVSFLV